MSLACPKCGGAIDQDFGLINCPTCGTVLAVDVEGNIQITEEAPAAASEIRSDPADMNIVEANFESASDDSLDQPMAPSENLTVVANPNESEAPNKPESESQIVAAQAVDHSEMGTVVANSQVLSSEETIVVSASEGNVTIQNDTETQMVKLKPQEEEYQDLMELVDAQHAAALEAENPKPANPDLEEIKNFGNKDSSYGPISYTLVLKDIDLAPIRRNLQEILAMPQFGWDHKELFKKISQGQLKLEKISPAQAVMLVRLLRGTNIQVSWSQNVYS